MLKSEFGHVWLLATLVCLLKFMDVNSCVVGGHISRNLFLILSIIHFSVAFCTAHCAVYLAKDHAP